MSERRRMPSERAGVTHKFKILTSKPAEVDTFRLDTLVTQLAALVGPNEPPEVRACVDGLVELVEASKEIEVGSLKGYLTHNDFEDGTSGEIFVKLDQQGSTVSGFVDAWAIAVSMLLQVGVPLEQIMRKYRGSRFEPSGRTENDSIRFCSSVVDYVARYLQGKYADEE